MKKEAIIAIVIGLIFGLGITFIVYQARVRIANIPTSPSLEEITQDPDQPETESIGELVILSPENESVQSSTQGVIRGKTLPLSHVVVIAADQSYITTANEDGDFSVSAELESGINAITTTVLTSDGKQLTDTRVVIVSDVLDVPTDEPTENEGTQDSGESQEDSE